MSEHDAVPFDPLAGHVVVLGPGAADGGARWISRAV
jgi:hypothetical protein